MPGPYKKESLLLLPFITKTNVSVKNEITVLKKINYYNFNCVKIL